MSYKRKEIQNQTKYERQIKGADLEMHLKSI